GYIRRPEAARQLSSAAGLHAWREAKSERIGDSVPAHSARFVRALALGDTRAIDDADWLVLRANGLTHLIAISGFHVGLVAGFFALGIAGTWWLFPWLGRRWPRPVAAAIAGLAGAAIYAAVAGFALPTVRTVLMIAVIAAVRILRRRSGPFQTLALAAMAVLLADPLSVLGAGFWLSFFGVGWLLWCLPDAGGRPVRDFLSAQGVATLGLLPLSAVLFGQASLAGIFANLLAVPWWSLVVVPLALIGTGLEAIQAGWGWLPWRAAAWCFDLVWPVFEYLAGTGLALWWLPESRWFALPLAMLGAFWLLLPRGLPGKPLALLLWLPLLWPSRNLPAPGEAEIVVLDVGQGLSVLVRTRHHNLLYDMGPAVRDGFDAGERAVVPALHALGMTRIDRAVVSHGDSDHAGGFAAVRDSVRVVHALAPADSPVAGTTPCRAGDRWNWDGVEFRFLHPPLHFPYLGNEASCVLRIETLHGTALLTGDIGQVIERELAKRDRASVRADVVLVAHHGSRHSSDPGFIAATGARHALVSTGHGNRFGHPDGDVLARWSRVGANTLDTADSGALRIRLGASGVEVETRRQAHPRLWDAAARSKRAPPGLSYEPD
nr:DNA internalization-related competence protein ComEC/Rec2 [Pseudomonadota bacterium]